MPVKGTKGLVIAVANTVSEAEIKKCNALYILFWGKYWPGFTDRALIKPDQLGHLSNVR